jgi:hypothetical protein
MGIYAIDIDNTLCSQELGGYQYCKPFISRINLVKRMKLRGDTIIIHTARGNQHRGITEAQLKVWGVPYDELVMDKPKADKYIDDKGENASDFFRYNTVSG